MLYYAISLKMIEKQIFGRVYAELFVMNLLPSLQTHIYKNHCNNTRMTLLVNQRFVDSLGILILDCHQVVEFIVHFIILYFVLDFCQYFVVLAQLSKWLHFTDCGAVYYKIQIVSFITHVFCVYTG